MPQPPAQDHFQTIYGGAHTHLYDAMVLCEDVQGNLDAALLPFVGASLLDVGAGTGRVSRLLAPHVARIVSLDLNAPMLRMAQQHQRRAALPWWLTVGDAVRLPLRPNWADVVTAGWALGHFCGWFPAWRGLIDQALAEFTRVGKAGAAQIIIETLGTGAAQPAPPTTELAAFYDHLEKAHGFARQTLRTDYLFPDEQRARQLVAFFFGEEMTHQLDGVKLVEWTGFWSRRV